MEEAKVKKWRWGKKRWIVLAIIVVNIVLTALYSPIRPHIQVAPENLSHHPLFSAPLIGDFYLTNTMIAMLLVDVIVILVALAVRNATRGGSIQMPSGVAGVMELVVETVYNLTESTAGKHARRIFPWFATITLYVLVANWMELIPGVDSVGLIHLSEHGNEIQEIIPGVVTALVKGVDGEGEYGVIPIVRTLSTDLNFTLTMALISVIMTQVIGFQTQGPRYLLKFFPVHTLFKKPFFGPMDFLVGLLELISEMAKILSFAFRLFGVMFAGSVLLFIVGEMVPVFLQSFIVLFELFMGAIQAVVIGMLTMIFMAQATQGHGGEDSHAA